MDERAQEGAAATLRAALVIVVAGVALGVGFNALGLASRPPRGLSWITREEKLPSLEELQGHSQALPVAPAPVAPGAWLVGTAWAGERSSRVAVADTVRSKPVRVKPARTVKRKPTSRPAEPAAPVEPAPGVPARMPVVKVRAPGETPPAVAKSDLPAVPDLDQPIEVKLPNVKKFFDAGAAAFVDARETSEYVEGHIRGAASVPFDDAVAKPALLDAYKHLGRPIIVYCSGGDCELSKDLAKNMLAEGIRKVLVFTDGFPAWKAVGYPVETGAPKAGR